MRVISTPAIEVYTSFQVIKYSSTTCIMATEDMSKFSQPITIPKHIDCSSFCSMLEQTFPQQSPGTQVISLEKKFL